MSSYAQAFEIPQDFPPILREFAKEAIREQPPDIYEFGRDYFENLHSLRLTAIGKDSEEEYLQPHVNVGTANQQEEELEKSDVYADSNPLVGDALVDRIAMLFHGADSDGNGTLSRMEFQEVLGLFGEEIGLKPRDILQIMAEADDNDDGVIEYQEFLPFAAEIIQAIIAKEQYSENKVIRNQEISAAKSDVRDYLMKGLPRDELEASIQEIFRKADIDGNGSLDRAEFLRCLKESGLGFTRRELNLVTTLIDKDGDGIVDYEEFMPACFSMIVEILSDKVQEIPEEEIVLSERIRNLLLNANGNEERLPAAVASECLLNAGLGLRFVQVPAMMSSVDEDEDGLVDSKEVANAAAGIMYALKQIHARQLVSAEDETVKDFKTSRRPEGLARVAGLDVDEFEDKLAGILKARDDGIAGSVGSKAVLREVIKEAFPGLDDRQVHALDNLSEKREDGRWSVENVQKWGFRTLQELEDQNILMKSIKVTMH